MKLQDKYRPRRFFGEQALFDSLPDMLKNCGMDYGVHKQQVSVPTWFGGMPDKNGSMAAVENQYVVRRSTDGVVVSPMTVSAKYGEIAPMDMLEDLDPFVLQKWATPDTAFKIQQGCVENVECIVLRLNIETDNPLQRETGDVYAGYLVARNYHGRGAASAALFLERTVSCSLLTALTDVSGFSIVHRGQVRDKYKLAFQRWSDLRKLIDEMAAKLRSYKEVPMSFQEAERFVQDLLEMNKGKVSTQKQNLYAAIMEAFNMPRFGTYGKSSVDMYHGITWVGSHYRASTSKLTDHDIMVGLLEGTRGNREKRAITLLDRFVSGKV